MTKRKGRKKTSKKTQEEDSEIVEEEIIEEPEPEIIDEVSKNKDFKNLSPNDFPEVGELVVATCTKITTHGGYFSIENYEI